MVLKNPQINPAPKNTVGRPKTLARLIADDLGLTSPLYQKGYRTVARYKLDRPMTPLARQVLINSICRDENRLKKLGRRALSSLKLLERLARIRRDWITRELPQPVSILSHTLDAGIDRTKWLSPAEMYAKRKGGRWPK